MPPPDRRIDVFLDKKSDPWGPVLRALRAILLDSPLTETFKWRQPCYAFQGKNVVILGNYHDFACLAFFRGALLSDPAGLLHTPGAHSQAARQLRFTDTAEVEARADTIRAYLDEAIALVKEGRTVDFRERHDLEYPQELIDALDADPDYAAAFRALTPGRQRGWVLLFADAKQPATRTARVSRARDSILQGKGRHDR